MGNKTNGNQFREDEIVILTHWDKRDEKWVKSIHPKIGGRLRLAHENNDQLSITSEIVKYDETIAVVKAVASTVKGHFPGLGMSSVERDNTIAPAILELAETRAIASNSRDTIVFSYQHNPPWLRFLVSRMARLVVPGIPHYVAQRGNRRQQTFFQTPSDGHT